MSISCTVAAVMLLLILQTKCTLTAAGIHGDKHMVLCARGFGFKLICQEEVI